MSTKCENGNLYEKMATPLITVMKMATLFFHDALVVYVLV